MELYTRKSDTRRLEDGLDGIRNEVTAIHPASANNTVVRNEKRPFTR